MSDPTDIVARLREDYGAQWCEHEPQTVIANYCDDRHEAADEIERLRAGGCARDQRATQYCAEAMALRAQLGATKRELHDALEMFALRTDDIMDVNRELERVKVALANAISERDALRAALLRIEHMDEGCGGNLTDREIWRQMQAVAGAARNG